MITHDRGDRVDIIKSGPMYHKVGEVVMIDAQQTPTLYTIRLDEPTRDGRRLKILADDEFISHPTDSDS